MTETQTRAQALLDAYELKLKQCAWNSGGISTETALALCEECGERERAAVVIRDLLAQLAQEQHARHEVERKLAKPEDAREYRRRTGIEVDNHHNALTCPYCNPGQLVLISPIRLREFTERAEVAESSLSSLQEEIARLKQQLKTYEEHDHARAGRSVPEHSPERATAATDGSGA
jgi:anti-sigma factor ChrR (cupin superfamily)